MTKLEDTNKWPTVVRMAGEGASLREIAEEVDATPGAINVALKRMGIEKAPAPPGPRARRGASPPPVKAPKAPKVKGEKQPRQKAPKAAKPKTFPEVLVEALGEFGFTGVPGHFMSTPEAAGIGLRAIFLNLGLTPKDNLSDTDDCDENAESDDMSSVSAVNDPDVSGEDDGGDCDGFDTDHVRFAFGLNGESTDDVGDGDPEFAMTDDFMGPVPSGNGPEWFDEEAYVTPESSAQTDFDGLNVVGLPVVTFDADSQPSVVGEVISQEINEDGGLSVQIAVDPNEVTLRGEVIDDWGTPPGFTIPDDETLSTMNRDDLRKLAANPGLKGWAYLKGYSKMSPDDLRANLAKVRNDSV